MNALTLALQESIRKQSDRTVATAAREQKARNQQSNTGQYLGYDAARGKHQVSLPDGSVAATDYESNSGVRVGETLGVVLPKYSLVGKSYKLPR